MTRPIALLTEERSVGVHRYAEDLAAALAAAGVDAAVRDGPLPGEAAHFHLSNSTRRLLPAVAVASRPSLVTVHDVVARQRTIRPLLAAACSLAMRGHRSIVHSRHAEDMLRDIGFRGRTDVIRLGAWERRFPVEELAGLRDELAPDGRPVLVAAGLIRAARGAVDLLRVAAGFPQFVFLFVGRPVGRDVLALLADAPGNVVHRAAADHGAFLRHIAASDLLLNFRSSSVGEASGPVCEAHAVGTPVAGWTSGSLPEYCGEHDRLFEPGTPLPGALRSLLAEGLPGRLPLGSPVVTTWERSAAMHADVYRDLGWL